MVAVEHIAKARPPAELERTNRRIDVRARGLARALEPWFRRFAQHELRQAIAAPFAYAGPLSIDRRGVPIAKEKKDDPRTLSEDLRRLLLLFGLREAADAANGVAGKVLIPESLIRDATEDKPVKIKWFWDQRDGILRRVEDIMESTRKQARDSVKRIILESLDEYPRPGPGEIARRISNAFLGPGEDARERRVHASEHQRRTRGPTWTLSDRSRREGEVMVRVSVDAVERDFAKDPDYYVGPGGKGEIGGRYASAQRFLDDAESVHASQVGISNGRIAFVDGRHRFAALRDRGVKTIVVAASQAEARELHARYGAPAPPRDEEDIRSLIFSPERAAIIARTELAQAENSGIYAGYVETGVEEIEWLAYSDGRSGKRHHERMKGVRVKVGEMFTLPSGAQIRFPGDPSGPISETIQCRCSTRAHRRKR